MVRTLRHSTRIYLNMQHAGYTQCRPPKVLIRLVRNRKFRLHFTDGVAYSNNQIVLVYTEAIKLNTLSESIIDRKQTKLQFFHAEKMKAYFFRTDFLSCTFAYIDPYMCSHRLWIHHIRIRIHGKCVKTIPT
jgi:hypothetical protein